jgi:cholesterol oxidase
VLAAAGAAFGCGRDERIERAKAVVIGTGFGGSIAAHRLAEAGIDVVVLERGQRWTVTDAEDTFPSVRAPDRRAAWFANKTVLPGAPTATFEPYAGLLELIESPNLDVIAGAGVGGNSLIFAGIMLQPIQALFERTFPKEVLYAEMDADYYPRVRKMMRAASIPDDILSSEPYASTRVFIEQAKNAGFFPEITLNAIDWDLIRKELTGEKKPSAIAGDYNYGLNSGAKNSLDRTYLAAAEKTGRVDVRPLHVVKGIASLGAGGYLVTAERIDEEGAVLEMVTLRTPYLFLGAGSMGTTKLLLTAAARGDLMNLGPKLGQGFGNNGQILAVRAGVGVPTGAYQGGPPAAFVRDYDNVHAPISLEVGPAPFGFECQCLINVCHGIPDQTGSLTLDPDTGNVVVLWDKAYMAKTQAGFDATLAALNAASGGNVIPFAGVSGSDTTCHPLGGAAMGLVCDSWGRIEGHPGLYVVDGALIPAATGCANPALTIGAIAERCMDRILAENLSG